MEQQNRHQTSHGYTSHIQSFNVVGVVPTESRQDRKRPKVWPTNVKQKKEREVHVGPLSIPESLDDSVVPDPES